ncbi:MAG: ATP-binding protein [Aureliella sp.]
MRSKHSPDAQVSKRTHCAAASPAVEGCPLADALAEQFRFERLLFDVSASFVNLPLPEINVQIQRSLQRLGRYLAVDRSSFAQYSEGKPDMVVTHCYVASGITPFPPVIVDGELPWYSEQIRRGRVVRFSRLPDELPAEAVIERAYCGREGLKSNLAIPLKTGDGRNCVLTFATFRNYREWSDELIQRLQLIGQIFASSLARKHSEEKLWQLRDQQTRMARIAMLGELAAAIAHEINQPLCAIVSNAQASQRILSAAEPDLEELSGALEDIASDSLRASAVVAKLRGMLQKRQPQSEPLQVNDAVGEAIALMGRQLDQAGVKLALDLKPDLPRVMGDRIQVQQVILNLALNAIDAMSHPQLDVRNLTIHTELLDDREVVVRVHDSGPGIDREHLAAVFDAFFTTKPTGIGIGLAISRSIVESHGGRIWAHSDPGQGATFQFTMPLRKGLS